MFSFLKKTAPARLPDFSLLGTDLHSHLLPGIDDGAPDLDTALALVQGLQALGFRQLFTTPHVMSDFYPNTRDLILRKKDELQEAIGELGMDLELGVAAEYYLDETFMALMHKEPLLTLPGQHVLVEMSFHRAYPELHRVVFDLQMKGYRPILAHPERYPYLKSADDYENLKAMGCAFQINLLSITGYYGKPIQQAAKTILNLELANFLATDLHHDRHLSQLQQALSNPVLVQTLQTKAFQNKEFTGF